MAVRKADALAAMWEPPCVITFEGQVVVVTGAGRGLGEAYARLIAARAGVVAVHDGGVGPDGTGGDAGPATAVRDSIVEAGGRASVRVFTRRVAGSTEDVRPAAVDPADG